MSSSFCNIAARDRRDRRTQRDAEPRRGRRRPAAELLRAAPPRRARGGIKLSSCPKGGSRPAAAHDDSEAGIETFARDYEISTSYENGSTCGAQAGENGLDGAAPKALATSAAARNTWLGLYKNYGADGLYADAFDSE